MHVSRPSHPPPPVRFRDSLRALRELRPPAPLRALGDLLASPRARRLVPLIAALVTATSLGNGIVRGDDSLQLLKARGVLAHGLGARLDLFDFVPGTPSGNARWADLGFVPWEAARNIRLAFFRPISSLSAFVDYNLFASTPWVMHAESIALYVAVVALVAAAYRRLLAPPVAMLAAFLYAVDDAHMIPVAWLANRNALFATAFGLLAWLAHDRWRRDGWRVGAVLAPLAFVGALLSAELGLATFAYLAAYAVALDPQRSKVRRAATLVPYAIVVVGWQVVYRALGYGARASGLYLDPVASPAVFARGVPQRLAALFLGQLALPPSDVSAYAPAAVRGALAIAGGLVVVFVARVIARDVRRNPTIRFFTIGAVLSALPTLAVVPSDRLLMLVGFGASGVIAHVIGDLRQAPEGSSRPARALRKAWIGIHVFIAPALLALGCLSPRIMNAVGERGIAGVALGPAIASQTLVIVNAPNVFAYQPILFPPDDAQPRPAHLRALITTSRPVDVRRLDTRTLAVEVGPGPKSDGFTSLYRDEAHPLHAGDVVDVPGMRVVVERVDADGDPVALRVQLDRDLGDPSLRWLAWRDGALVDMVLPPVGGVRTLGPA